MKLGILFVVAFAGLSACNAFHGNSPQADSASDPALRKPIALWSNVFTQNHTVGVKNLTVSCIRDLTVSPADQANGVKRRIVIGGAAITSDDPTGATGPWSDAQYLGRYQESSNGQWQELKSYIADPGQNDLHACFNGYDPSQWK